MSIHNNAFNRFDRWSRQPVLFFLLGKMHGSKRIYSGFDAELLLDVAIIFRGESR
jgi:hypothetical protein